MKRSLPTPKVHGSKLSVIKPTLIAQYLSANCFEKTKNNQDWPFYKRFNSDEHLSSNYSTADSISLEIKNVVGLHPTKC